MGMASVQASKEKLVAEILANPTYQPGSGVMVRLRERLLRLAKDDLVMLKLILELGRGSAVDSGR